MRMPEMKPRLSVPRILEMNLGFLGLQFSFGLQQGNMAPIYSYLGASEASLPLLQLAGPMTGLLVQPLIGALSDRTDSRWGRRTPYFLVGALMCAIGLFCMPLSSSILMAVSLLWILDAGNNITMEPYRAYVSDRLDPSQHQIGFLTQSAFTGLAQMLAFLTPSLLVWAGMNQDWVDAHNIPYTARIAFMVGAVLSLTTIVYSRARTAAVARRARADRGGAQGAGGGAARDRHRDSPDAAGDAQAGADEPVPMVCDDGLLGLCHLRDRPVGLWHRRRDLQRLPFRGADQRRDGGLV
jgi:hypothetical protein